MRETTLTSYAYIKEFPGSVLAWIPAYVTPSSRSRSPTQLGRDPPSPERPPSHTLSLGGCKVSQSSPHLTFGRGGLRGTWWASLHARVLVPGLQAAGILGCGRLDRRGSRLLDSSRPALLGSRVTHFRVVTETFCSL